MSLQSGSISVLLCALSVPGQMEVHAPKLQVDVCTFRRVVLHSLVLQCALSHSCHARSPCLSARCRKVPGSPGLCVCSLCVSGTEHPGARACWLGDVQSWEGWDSIQALAETGGYKLI